MYKDIGLGFCSTGRRVLGDLASSRTLARGFEDRSLQVLRTGLYQSDPPGSGMLG
jgi:hypothetical protein